MSTQGKAQFTPGPWTVQLHNDLDTGDIRGANNEEIAICYMPDATLIAAAPAMYEALQWAKQYLRMPDFHPDNSYNSEEWARDYNKLNDALAQAEGR